MDNETKEMLQHILSKVTSLDDKVSSLEDGQQELKQDFTAMKQDFTAMKQDFTAMKQDFTAMKQELSEVKQLATKTAITLENDISKKLGYLYDQAKDNARHYEEQKQLAYTVEVLQHDVSALKMAHIVNVD